MNSTERTAYIRDASGNIMAVYQYKSRWSHTEQHLYGADRLGVHNKPVPLPTSGHTYLHLAVKRYEIANHLGNVMVVVTDRRFVNAGSSSATAEVVTATDYFPFGMEMPGRVSASDGYGYGFNAQMESPEILPGHTTAMFWEYDARIGRRWELDPKTVTGWSGYACLGDSPVRFNDLLGDTFDDPKDNAKVEKMKSYASKESERLGESIKSLEEQLTRTGDVDIAKKRSLLTERRELKVQKNQFDDFITEATEMQSSSVKFVIRNSLNGGGTKPVGNEIVITYSGGDDILAHELKHGYQFLAGETSFDPEKSGPGLLYDVYDEEAAYERQRVFAGGSISLLLSNGTTGTYSSVNSINPSVIMNLGQRDMLGDVSPIYPSNMRMIKLDVKTVMTQAVLDLWGIKATSGNVIYENYITSFPEDCGTLDYSIICIK